MRFLSKSLEASLRYAQAQVNLPLHVSLRLFRFFTIHVKKWLDASSGKDNIVNAYLTNERRAHSSNVNRSLGSGLNNGSELRRVKGRDLRVVRRRRRWYILKLRQLNTTNNQLICSSHDVY